MQVYQTSRTWNGERPRTLVIACSDGRFQEEVDEFLQYHLAIDHYARLYVPGGAGALATSGIERARGERNLGECRFLISVHGIERIILLFHAPAVDGPAEATCGDYRRKLPTSSPAAIRRQQEQDAEQIWRDGLGDGIRLEIYRCEVTRDGLVGFVRMYD